MVILIWLVKLQYPQKEVFNVKPEFDKSVLPDTNADIINQEATWQEYEMIIILINVKFDNDMHSF